MKIYFNGDSNVAGTELEDPSTQGFAAKLSNKFGATFVNDAGHGFSNSLILRNIHEFLLNCKQTNNFPDLIVIGWTEWMREDWYINKKYRSISSIGLEHPEDVDHASYKYWDRYMHHSPMFSQQMSKFYNRAIHNLHLELQDLNIPHVFFNAIDPLNHAECMLRDGNIGLAQMLKDDSIFFLDWNQCYLYPYDTPSMTWRQWAIARNYEEITPGWYHFKEDCQEAWAEIIFDYIKEQKII